jgi:hypothetical protein
MKGERLSRLVRFLESLARSYEARKIGKAHSKIGLPSL